MSDEIILGGAEQQADSRKTLEDAAADAQHLMTNSPIIPKLVAVDIIARQLFLLVRHGLMAEISQGWEIENPELVLKTLGMAAQEKAIAEEVRPIALRDNLLTTVLPVIDIFCQMEQEHNVQAETNDKPCVPGDDPGAAE